MGLAHRGGGYGPDPSTVASPHRCHLKQQVCRQVGQVVLSFERRTFLKPYTKSSQLLHKQGLSAPSHPACSYVPARDCLKQVEDGI